MRLWSWQFLDCLDDFHIVAQWRELLAIKGAIDKNGTPNHRLVNKVLDFNVDDFKRYTRLVINQLEKRNIKFNHDKYKEILCWNNNSFANHLMNENSQIYNTWHNLRYLTQCYYNLQEKHDCGIVSDSAWQKIENRYKEIMK